MKSGFFWLCPQNDKLSLILFLVLLSSAARAGLVAVDVGHYLAEPGATSARGRPEFEFNRRLAMEIVKALRDRKIGVQVVGADGGMVRLTSRTATARDADFFLSVHHDSAQEHFLEAWDFDGTPQRFSDRFAGFSLFVSRKSAYLARSLRCASAMGAELREAGFTPSLYHADNIPGERKPFADRENGVHYYDNLIVLKTARSPAVLLEAGVIINREEELKLLSPGVHARMAAAVARALARCLPPGARPAAD